jgi:hypothetical protein
VHRLKLIEELISTQYKQQKRLIRIKRFLVLDS